MANLLSIFLEISSLFVDNPADSRTVNIVPSEHYWDRILPDNTRCSLL